MSHKHVLTPAMWKDGHKSSCDCKGKSITDQADEEVPKVKQISYWWLTWTGIYWLVEFFKEGQTVATWSYVLCLKVAYA